MRALRHLNKYFLKYKYRLLIGLVITIIARIFAVAVPKFVGDSVDIVEQYINNSITNIEDVKNGIDHQYTLDFWICSDRCFFYFFNATNVYCSISIYRV